MEPELKLHPGSLEYFLLSYSLSVTLTAQLWIPPGPCPQVRMSMVFRVWFFSKPCSQPLGRPCTWAGAGCQAYTSACRQQFSQMLHDVLISSLSPELSLKSQQRAINSSGQEEGGRPCLHKSSLGGGLLFWLL